MNFTINDRLTIGLIAGIIAGIVMDLYSYLINFLNLTSLRFVDWTAIMIYGELHFSFAQLALAQGAHLVFTGALGILFVYLIPKVTSKNFVLKGWLYGVISWFLIYAITLIFKVKGTVPINFNTALVNLIGSSIFGLVLAETILWLRNRYKVLD